MLPMLRRLSYTQTGSESELLELKRKIKAQDYILPDSLNLTQECKTLLRALLQPDPSQRVSMAGILANPWFKADLRHDALTMNVHYLNSSLPGQQSKEEIKHIIAEATAGVLR
jgi:serine/threonine-protein kinase SRK2